MSNVIDLDAFRASKVKPVFKPQEFYIYFDEIKELWAADIDGTPTQLAGNRQVLTPSVRVGGGILYAPPIR